MTNGRDLESIDWDEQAEPINRVDAMIVATANGQEEKNTAMRRQHGKRVLVHRDVASVGRLRRAYDFYCFRLNRTMEFAALCRKLPGMQVDLAHVLSPIRGK